MKKNSTLRLAATAALSVTLTGQSACAALAYSGRGVAMGGIYADSAANEQLTAHKQGSKHGQACSSSILGLVTTGDASAATAAQMAQISEISTIDHRFTNILGVWSRYCTVVSGESVSLSRGQDARVPGGQLSPPESTCEIS